MDYLVYCVYVCEELVVFGVVGNQFMVKVFGVLVDQYVVEIEYYCFDCYVNFVVSMFVSGCGVIVLFDSELLFQMK